MRAFCPAALILALALPALACDDTATLHEDPHHTIFARADSIDTLRKRTKPTLAYPSGETSEDFIWTALAADGKRYFTHATVYRNEIPGTRRDWVILGHSLTPSGSIRARITAPVVPGADPAKAPRSTYWPPKTAAAATILAEHKTHGTLYQFSIDRGNFDDIDQHLEERILILHDAKGWRYVTTVWANESTATGTPDTENGASTRTVRTAVAWTGKSDAPLQITCTASVSHRQEEAGIAYQQRWTLAGALPIDPPETLPCTLNVRAGDTLSAIAARLAPWAYAETTPAQMQRELLALNAKLKKAPATLHPGDRLAIPQLSCTPWPPKKPAKPTHSRTVTSNF